LILETNNLTMKFGGLTALSNVSLKINKGEIRGLIGPNGSGKTTFLNVVTGFYKATSGSVNFNGADISKELPHTIANKGLVRTFQNINLFPHMTALENVLTGSFCRSKDNFLLSILPRKTQEEKRMTAEAENILLFVGLEKEIHSKACNLPYGKQRLLEIARALASNPEILLLDEPVAGMNEQESLSVAELLQKLQKTGLTILLIEHHMRFVMSVCDGLTVLNSGAVIAKGTPEEIQNNDEVIAVYLGKRHKKC